MFFTIVLFVCIFYTLSHTPGLQIWYSSVSLPNKIRAGLPKSHSLPVISLRCPSMPSPLLPHSSPGPNKRFRHRILRLPLRSCHPTLSQEDDSVRILAPAINTVPKSFDVCSSLFRVADHLDGPRRLVGEDTRCRQTRWFSAGSCLKDYT